MKKIKGLYKLIKWLLIIWLVQHFFRFGFDSILQDVLFLLLVPYIVIGGLLAPFIIFIMSVLGDIFSPKK